MNLQELDRHLSTKRRTIADVARFVSTRTDQNPNYTLLLGAGCSVSSGVRSASELSMQWRADLYYALAGDKAKRTATADEQREWLKAYQGNWYDPAREYSALFEKKYDMQRQRRMFVETEVSGKIPSIGYAYLTALITQNYFNTVFTTNFDDLVNEAFNLYSDQRPIVCAHDSSINSVTVTSRRPKIIKLHGDYLFEDLKSTTRETESLEANMKSKFVEFAKDYGLIVVGYGGGDRSIMDVLTSLLKSDEYLKGGVYWCMRSDAYVSEDLKKLLWREKAFFVEIDGFDELFSALYFQFNEKDVLPVSAVTVTHRRAQVVSQLLGSKTAFPTTTEVLRRARERLLKQSKRAALANLIARPDGDDRRPALEGSFTEDELIVLMEIKNLIESANYASAIEAARARLLEPVKPHMKYELLSLIIRAQARSGKREEARRAVEELINARPKNALAYLRKAGLCENHKDRGEAINDAIRVDPYSVPARIALGSHFRSDARTAYGQARKELVANAEAQFAHGIKLDPSYSNPCWRETFDLIREYEKDVGVRKERLRQIVDAVSQSNPYSLNALSLKVTLLDSGASLATVSPLLAEIQEAKDRYWKDDSYDYDRMRLVALSKAGEVEEVLKGIEDLETEGALAQDNDLTEFVAAFLREKKGDDERAVSILNKSLQIGEFDPDILERLIEALEDLGRISEAEELLEKWKDRLGPRTMSDLRSTLFDSKGEFNLALAESSRGISLKGLDRAHHRAYLLLRKGDFVHAEAEARKVLKEINYSAEADVVIVNLELAVKKQQRKADVNRLESVCKYSDSEEVKASAYAVLGRKADMLAAIRHAMKEDKTFRFRAAIWPVFDDVRNDAEFLKAIAV